MCSDDYELFRNWKVGNSSSLHYLGDQSCGVSVLLSVERNSSSAVRSCPRSNALGNHFKTGHTLSLQNRPTEVIQNNTSYTLNGSVVANVFHDFVLRIYTDCSSAGRQRRDAIGA